MLSHSKKIDRYIKNAPERDRVILEKVRALILRTLPEVSEVFKYNVPYYDSVCYTRRGKGEVIVSFCFGTALPKKYHLEKGKSRFVMNYRISSVSGIRPRRLQELLRIAYRKRGLHLLTRRGTYKHVRTT